jgi:hypothetical protein
MLAYFLIRLKRLWKIGCLGFSTFAQKKSIRPCEFLGTCNMTLQPQESLLRMKPCWVCGENEFSHKCQRQENKPNPNCNLKNKQTCGHSKNGKSHTKRKKDFLIYSGASSSSPFAASFALMALLSVIKSLYLRA